MRLLQFKNNDGSTQVRLFGTENEQLGSTTVAVPLTDGQLYAIEELFNIVDDIIDGLHVELDEVTQYADQLECQLENAGQQIESLKQEVAELQRELAKMETYSDQLEAALRQMEDELHDLKNQ